jgi:phosphodiesterase/alkaline phosphatase D-like protein
MRRAIRHRGWPLALVVATLMFGSVAHAAAATYTETTGPGPTHTWTNYHNAGGSEGPSIPDNSTIQVTCRAEGFRVEDGNTWWYQIASSPWNNVYWASADAFYNNGQTSGPLKGTPFVDPKVRLCSEPEPTSPPSVATGAASSVTQSSATLNASVNPNGGNVTSCQLEYGTSGPYGSAVACSSLPGSGTSPVGVSAAISGLSPNTTYHYRIVATNAGGTSYGSEQTFNTLPNPPALTTEAASSISQNTATLNADVNPEGGNVTSCQFEYGTTNLYGSTAECSSLPGSGTSPFAVSASIAGLTPNTTYYYRIIATNTSGTSYGSEDNFNTPPNAPALDTETASSVSQEAATLNATVNPEGGDVSSCQFEYGTTNLYGSAVACAALPGSGETPVAVFASPSGLTANTTYHYRIVATNAGGTSYGSEQTFSTLVDPPTLLTAGPSSLGQVSVTLNASVNPNDGPVSTCQFEYGTTEAYGSTAGCSPTPGSGSSPIALSALLIDLTPNTTYHYRILATNPGGTSQTADVGETG